MPEKVTVTDESLFAVYRIGLPGIPRNAVFPSADTDTRTAIVEALVPNADHRLLPGSFVTMKIARPATADKMLVPAGAVISSEGQSFVWIARGVTAAAGSTYECSVCHMHYSAAQAERLHFRDPMDGGILTPIAAAPPSGPLTAHQVTVETGASDGAWTAVVSSDLKPGDRVVAHGQAGLMEGAQIVETAWGPDGPKSLPTAASANAGLTLYRCEKCGMTYSEADARKNHFVDPMDGGRLIAVTSGQGSANR